MKNINILLVGTGNMGIEYSKVLKNGGWPFSVIGHSESGVQVFENHTKIKALQGGIEKNRNLIIDKFTHAIVATSVHSHMEVVKEILDLGIKEILVEKPAGADSKEVVELLNYSQKKNAKVWVAYNRRFYESVDMAEEMIIKDGGIRAVYFEFTEWLDRLHQVAIKRKDSINIFFENSTHVIDLAFFFAGLPKNFKSYATGNVGWSKDKVSYVGAGITDRNILFSYHADWNAPGRWGLEVLTDKNRYIFRPMEELQVQTKGSINIESVKLKDDLDKRFKPGIFSMVDTFINKGSKKYKLLSLEEYEKMTEIYDKMSN